MNFQQRCVAEFHSAFSVPFSYEPVIPSDERLALRVELIREEAQEFKEAAEARDIIEMADALGDLLVVVNGAALELGINLEDVFNEIHKSNMSKLGEDGKPIFREDGKILKGPKFFKPDIKRVLFGNHENHLR